MTHRLRRLALRVFASLAPRRSTPGLDDEFRFHIDMAVESYLRQGLAPEEARRRALADFGGLQQIREHYRDQKGLPMLETTLQDLRYGLRVLAANRSFTAMAVLSLALGIGANTAIFSLLYALLLRPLPVPNPGELMQVNITIAGKTSDSFSYPVIQALAERKDIFAALGGFAGNSFTVGPPSAPVRTPGAWVSGGFFQALQLTPAAGRLLLPEDDRPGAGLAAVISNAYWERSFQRGPSAVGATLIVQGLPVTIVGVTPPGFTGANIGEVADLTLPYQFLSHLSPDRQGLLQAGNQFSRIVARPVRGVSIEQARARLKAIWPAMAQVSVNPRTPQKRREAMLASTLDLSAGGTGWTPLRSQYSKPLTVLMVISALVLLLACTNVANLLLARSAARRREFAIRLAIGAGRARVMRQLLVESLLLSFLGAALGLLLAHYGSRLLLTQVSETIRLDVGLNLAVLEFAVAAAVVTGLLFGTAPALRSTSSGCATALRTASSSGQARGRLAGALVTVQVALSFLLLIGAGLFVRTLHNLESVDPGFRHEGVLMADLDGRRIVHPGPAADARIAALFHDALDAVTAVNGVTAAALSNFTPISGGYWSQAVQVKGQPPSDDDIVFFATSPGFFSTLSMPLFAGRDFTLRDDATGPPAAIVNQEFARRFLPGINPLGQVISAADSRYWKNMEIVGVVGDSHPYTLRDAPRPCVYVPFFQQAPDRIGYGTFEVKAAGSLNAAAADLSRILSRVAPGADLRIRPFTAQVESSMRRERLMARLAGFFGILALVLAAVGLYGLLAYTVAQRTAEVGIRIALGAEPGAVVRMMLARGMYPVAAGILIGLPFAWWTTSFISTLLYGLKPFDPLTIAAAIGTLAAVALAAGFIPARRAAKVDPMTSLRQD
jgi:predicted permease